jgi:hypothetical protein
MDFCSNCGEKTDPEWVFCRACGSGLDLPEIEPQPAPAATQPAAPKVELISRTWDVVEIAPEGPADPLENDISDAPLPPGAVEIAVDGVAVVESPKTDPAEIEDPLQAHTAEPPATVEEGADAWDYLRPHGEVPPLLRRSSVPARVAVLLVLLFSLSAIVASMLHFYLNTRLESFSTGRVSYLVVEDAVKMADIGLIVTAGLGVAALGSLLWWTLKRDRTKSLRPGPAGIVAPLATLAGGALIAWFYNDDQSTVSDALTANTFIILGLGLVTLAGLAVVRSLGRIEHRDAR